MEYVKELESWEIENFIEKKILMKLASHVDEALFQLSNGTYSGLSPLIYAKTKAQVLLFDGVYSEGSDEETLLNLMIIELNEYAPV